MDPKIVNVTENVIRETPPNGVEGDNPVMRAICEQYGSARESTYMLGVDEVVANAGYPECLPYRIALPQEAQKLIKDFYAGRAIAPIRFECEPVYNAALVERRRDDWLAEWTKEVRRRGWRVKDVRKHTDWFLNVHRVECDACKVNHSTHVVEISRDYAVRLLDESGAEKIWRSSEVRRVCLCDSVMGAFLGAFNREAERRRMSKRNWGGRLIAALGERISLLGQFSRLLQAQLWG